MSLGSFFMRVHEAACRVVLGKKRLAAAAETKAQEEERRGRIDAKCREVEEENARIKRDLGLVANGSESGA